MSGSDKNATGPARRRAHGHTRAALVLALTSGISTPSVAPGATTSASAWRVDVFANSTTAAVRAYPRLNPRPRRGYKGRARRV